MRRVTHNNGSADGLLYGVIGRSEESAFLFGNFKNMLVIGGDSKEIHRYYDFSFLCYSGFQPVIVHREFARPAIYHNDLCADMRSDACRRRIGISGDDNLIFGADA